MKAFRQIVDIPLVARKSVLAREEIRRRLGYADDERIVLFSFGGFKTDVPIEKGNGGRITLLSTDPAPDPGPPFRHISNAVRTELGLRYCDLVAAGDAVVSKPGYGIVSECIANRTPLLYTPRGHFREYPILVRAIKRYLPARQISVADLCNGRWLKAFEELREKGAQQQPLSTAARSIDCNGASTVAQKLLSLLTCQ